MKHMTLLLAAAMLAASLVTGCRSRGNDNRTPSTTTVPTTMPTATAATVPDMTTDTTQTTTETTQETGTYSDPGITANTETTAE